jgi:alcohol-forming fatty acyl-CoA reductase
LIREALKGKRALITGGGGFLGQALIERLLSDFPDTQIVLVMRRSADASAEERVERLKDKPVFSSLRARDGDGGLYGLFSTRIDVVEGDVSQPLPSLPSDIDVVFHCAATVSFDPPIEQAFKTNLTGVVNLHEALHASGSRPHVVHVSTAYVAGLRKGVVPETSLDHVIDWRAEAEAARAATQEAEIASRVPERLASFLAEATAEHGRAGPQTATADAERRRREWVTQRLVEYGRQRARTLGWPDVYTLTKALGERAAEELRGDFPLSIVRPSIIESALAHPYPGWIDGYKMAEPIILAYGRGTLPEFPGIPEGIVDIIPVDLVVNAMLAIAAQPSPSEVDYFHVSSGWRNPLTYRRLYELVSDYFRAHPLSARGTGEIAVPEWRFPGKAKVEPALKAAERMLDVADRVVTRIPRSSRTRTAVRAVDRQRRRVDFLRRYSDLYTSYTEAEVIYSDDRTRELFESLSGDDRSAYGFDSAVIDWPTYLQDIHCPMVTWPLRANPPARRSVSSEPRPSQKSVVAVFDLEGTIHTSNVVESYMWVRAAHVPPSKWPVEIANLARSMPSLLAAERRDRGEFIRSFYRRYKGASHGSLQEVVEESVGKLILQRTSPAAIRRIREHRALGHRTLLITGALELYIAPLAPLFDEIIGARLVVDGDGRYTGDLERPPLVGEARAAWLRRYAASTGVDLAESYAYADSYSDLPLLEAVGNPVAVNPDVALYRAARRNEWPTEEWQPSPGTPRVLMSEVRV